MGRNYFFLKRYLPSTRIESRPPALQVDSLPSKPSGKPSIKSVYRYSGGVLLSHWLLVSAVFMLYLHPWSGQFFENKFNNLGEIFFSMLQNQLCSVKITRFYFLFLCFCESLPVRIALASQYMISTNSQNISDDWVCFERKTLPIVNIWQRTEMAMQKIFFLNIYILFKYSWLNDVSGAQQGDLVIHIHIYYFWDYFPLQVIISYWL